MGNPVSHQTYSTLRLFCLILLLGCSAIHSADPFQQTCSSGSDTCASYVGYSYKSGTELQQIAGLFSVNASDIFGANDLNVTELTKAGSAILSLNQTLRIPVTCACVKNLHRVDSIIYTIQSGDTLSQIADSIFSGLITYQDIANANGIPDPNKIYASQKIVIPFPCSCLKGTFIGQPLVSMAYVVSHGDTLDGIAAKTDAQATDIATLNSLNNSVVKLGDVLDIPIPACSSSFSKSAKDYGLTVTRGSYYITANGCVLCICGSNATNLYCSPAPAPTGTCPQLTCSGGNLIIGETRNQVSHTSCSVTSCVYQGYSGGQVYSSIQTSEESSCPAPLHAPPFSPVALGPIASAPQPVVPLAPPLSPQLIPTQPSPPPGGFPTPKLPFPPLAGSPSPSFGFICHESSMFVVVVTTLAFFLSSQF